jgi:putative salt-induced outer membrane protein YdiY
MDKGNKKMKAVGTILLVMGMLMMGAECRADTLDLKNGDRLTGTITETDEKEITLKTDYAGEIKVQWGAVKGIATDNPLYVVTPEKTTVEGNVTLDGADLVVHTGAGGAVRVPLAELKTLRSTSEEEAYEKSLHPSLIEDWKGGVNLGLALARGNSDTTNFNAGITADRKTLTDEIALSTSAIYSTHGTTTTGGPGGVTADEVLGRGRYDRNITKALFAFGSGDFTHDALQDLTLRQIYTGGLGWHVIQTSRTTFDVLGGANYTRENYSAGGTVMQVSRNLPGITSGEILTRKLGTGTVLTEEFDFYPDLDDISQYRFSLDSGIVTKIGKWLGWQASLSDRYVTDPPIAGTKPNDVVLSTGLNITFNH